mmetsp:Transcript_9468/g.13212  ORF Transcript_9468/g.13212 Transcript_9468/m.13212 type:complete len:321 (+) Transcript_9468:93-1055(+)
MKEHEKASQLVKYIYRLARDPSLHTKADQPHRETSLRIRQEMKARAREARVRESKAPIKNEVLAGDGKSSKVKVKSTFARDSGLEEDPPSENSADYGNQQKKTNKSTRNLVKRRKKRKQKPRGSSPVHFQCGGHEENYGPKHTIGLPSRSRADKVLGSVAKIYYGATRLAGFENFSLNGNEEYPIYNTMEVLISPLRNPQPVDKWSMNDIALFESAICEHGKDFFKVARCIPGKTTEDIVQFYYGVWKYSYNGHIWRKKRKKKLGQEQTDEAFNEIRKATLNAFKRDVLGIAEDSDWHAKMRRGARNNGTQKPRRKKRRR